PTSTRGVSGLLQGDRTQLLPEGNERMARRRKLHVVDPGYETSCDTESQPASEAPRAESILQLPVVNHPAAPLRAMKGC
ncbi:MAG: hypothetical protein ACRCZF_11020, partial [Gemmataceae bacterium]